MQIEEKGSGNVINVAGPRSRAVTITVTGNNNRISVGNFSTGGLSITVDGDGCEIHLGNLRFAKKLSVLAKAGAKVSIGDKTSVMNASIFAIGSQVSIGQDCMLSFPVNIRTHDGHGIYDIHTGNMVNQAGPVEIGDHVWIGMQSIVCRGTRIGNGSIIGARSYVQNMTVPACSIAAGSPARILKHDVTWDRSMAGNLFDETAMISGDILSLLTDQHDKVS
ncbi:acyltransferase [Mycoplana ramosa]|uniref:Acyltransferase n=1 Tax=Mycoplana ramosa TaxID=40837 RepID=A0ABW3YTJ3_MYCRA